MAVVELTKENFEKVITSNPTVIVDYWAPWCGPCRGFAPVFEKVAEANPDVVFAKVNTEEEQEIAAHFQIRSIPTLMVFREQIIVFSQPGALPQGAFEQVVVKAKELDMEEVRKHMREQEKDESPEPPRAGAA
jgi:thioredoxin 1